MVAMRHGLAPLWIPFLVDCDHALAQHASGFRYALLRLGISIQRAVRRRPKQKSAVERFFLEVERFCQDYPGYAPDPKTTISELDPLATSLLTPKEFVQKFTRWVVNEYIHRPQDELGGRSPYEAWNELEPLQRIRMPENIAELDYLLANHYFRQLDADGIDHNNLIYVSRVLQPILDRYGPKCRVQISDDEADLGFITVFDPLDGTPYRTPTKPSMFSYASGLSLVRHKLIRQELPAKPGKTSTLEDWERRKVERVTEAHEMRRRGQKRTHITVALEASYNTAGLSRNEPTLETLSPRRSKADSAEIDNQDHMDGSQTTDLWTDDDLPDVEVDDDDVSSSKMPTSKDPHTTSGRQKER
ncbi:MAG: integrase core domain protein [Rhodospirillales bacterium]|nr:integrase core domain protein [Rhodospirillales bacterium]